MNEWTWDLRMWKAARLPCDIRVSTGCQRSVYNSLSFHSVRPTTNEPYIWYLPGSASLPTSPVTPVAPSMAVGDRLARSASDSRPETGTHRRREAPGIAGPCVCRQRHIRLFLRPMCRNHLPPLSCSACLLLPFVLLLAVLEVNVSFISKPPPNNLT